MRVVIVGGGAAGWISAGYLLRQFNSVKTVLDIILVESPTAGRIGVGEATFPTLRRTLQRLEIPEVEFMRRTSATFKHAVRFVDWVGKGHSFYHPFEALLDETDGEAGEAWIVRRATGEARPFAYDFGVQAYLADARRSPKLVSDPEYSGTLNYAYHVDADLLGDLLKDTMVANGVTHLREDVVDVVLDSEAGTIRTLKTRSGNCLDCDFVVDCTGFASVLIRKRLGVPFISYRSQLLCDRAVAMRLPYEDPAHTIDPFTTSRAMDAGWSWKVGLRDRSGEGYVYSSDFLSDEDAEREFRGRIGAPDDIPSRLLKFETGRTALAWEKNCAAIGLAAGFIEPLESTGIFLIEEGARLLARLLPVGHPEPEAAVAYNRYMQSLYEEIRDFIVLHYCCTRRGDTSFWREVVRSEHIPERLRDLLKIWHSRTPTTEDLATTHAFRALSYQYILYGMDCVSDDLLNASSLRRTAPVPTNLEGRRAELLRILPTHDDYLATLTGSV